MVDLASLVSGAAWTRKQVFRNFSVYSQGAKWGNASEATVELDASGGKEFFEAGVYIGSSWAPLKSSLQLTSFVPIGGKRYQQQILEALSRGKYVFVTVGEVGSQILQLGFMVVKQATVESHMARGSCVLHASFSGGSPDLLVSSKALPLRLGGL